MADLASIYMYQGRWKEAEELEEQVLGIRKRVLGSENPDTLTSMASLVFTLGSQGNSHDAVVIMEKCVRLRERLLGPAHPDTISSARSIREWIETVDLLTNNHQSFIQAENDQALRDIAQDTCSPAVMITGADEKEGLSNHHQDLVRPETPLRVLVKNHPLFFLLLGVVQL
jgi:hypothetical protein